jgi:hypothetical protein
MPKTSSKAITKVCYKPSTQSGDEFIVIVNFDEVSRSDKIDGGKVLIDVAWLQYKQWKDDRE